MSRGDTQALGLWGEEQVAAFLEQKGAQIVARRFRCRYGELDLIAQLPGYLCFVEVKLRKDDRFAKAREFVTYQKQQKLRLAAQTYLMEHPTELQPRFDVAELYAPRGMTAEGLQILYWENAF